MAHKAKDEVKKEKGSTEPTNDWIEATALTQPKRIEESNDDSDTMCPDNYVDPKSDPMYKIN